MADRDLLLLHDLEQRGLDLGRRAVDLVREQEVAEYGPELGLERPGVGAVDARAHQVGGHEVRGELEPLERSAQHIRDGLDRERLREPGHALEQHVAAGQQGHEQPLEHPLLADDDALDLEQRCLERRVRLTRRALFTAFKRPQADVFGAHVVV
jgi:hypothetical protein